MGRTFIIVVASLLLPLAALRAQNTELERLNKQTHELLEAWELPQAEQAAKRALSLTEKIHGPTDKAVLAPLFGLADTYRWQGLYAEYDGVSRRALGVARSACGDRDLRTADALWRVADAWCRLANECEAEPLMREALQICQMQDPPNERRTALAQHALSTTLRRMGRNTEAEELLRQALQTMRRVDEDGPETATVMEDLGEVLTRAKDNGEAEALLTQAVAMRRRTLPPNHPITAFSILGFGNLRSRRGQFPQAEALYSEAAAMSLASLGPDNPYTMWTQLHVARTCRRLGRTTEANVIADAIAARAEPILASEHGPVNADALDAATSALLDKGDCAAAEDLGSRSLARIEKEYGPDHPLVIRALETLARIYTKQGRFSENEATYRRILAACQVAQPGNYRRQASARGWICSALVSQRKYAEAEAFLGDALPELEKESAKQPLPYVMAVLWLRRTAYEQGRMEEAEALSRKALAMADSLTDGDEMYRWAAQRELVMSLLAQGKLAECEARARGFWRDEKEHSGPEDKGSILMGNVVAGACFRQRKFAEAEEIQRGLLALCERYHRSDDALIAATKEALGRTLVEQQEWGEASSVLFGALESLERASQPRESRRSTVLINLGIAESRQGDYESAATRLEQALAALERTSPTDGGWLAAARKELGIVRFYQGDNAEAIRLLREAGSAFDRELGPEHAETRYCMQWLAEVYHENGQHADAQALETRYGKCWYTRDQEARVRRWFLAGGGSLMAICMLIALVRLRRNRSTGPDQD